MIKTYDNEPDLRVNHTLSVEEVNDRYIHIVNACESLTIRRNNLNSAIVIFMMMIAMDDKKHTNMNLHTAGYDQGIKNLFFSLGK